MVTDRDLWHSNVRKINSLGGLFVCAWAGLILYPKAISLIMRTVP